MGIGVVNSLAMMGGHWASWILCSLSCALCRTFLVLNGSLIKTFLMRMEQQKKLSFLWRDQQNDLVVVADHFKWGPHFAQMPYLGPSNCKLNIFTLQIGALVTILSPQ